MVTKYLYGIKIWCPILWLHNKAFKVKNYMVWKKQTRWSFPIFYQECVWNLNKIFILNIEYLLFRENFRVKLQLLVINFQYQQATISLQNSTFPYISFTANIAGIDTKIIRIKENTIDHQLLKNLFTKIHCGKYSIFKKSETCYYTFYMNNFFNV